MANPHRGQVSIELGGKTYNLRYDANTIAEMEQKLGKSIQQITEMGGSIWVIREAIWAGLKCSGHNFSTSKVGSWMEPKKLREGYYGDKVAEGLKLALGVTDEDMAEAKAEAEVEDDEEDGDDPLEDDADTTGES